MKFCGGDFVKERLNNKNIWSVVMIVLIVAFDQITKYFAKLNLAPDKAVDFLKSFVEFRYAENTGAAFSFLSGGRWFFVAFTAIFTVACIVYMFKKAQSNLWLYWSLGVVISGAIGNLIDRIAFGFVIDFINPIFVDFAIFNIADCAVTLGCISLVACLLVDAFKKENKEKDNE